MVRSLLLIRFFELTCLYGLSVLIVDSKFINSSIYVFFFLPFVQFHQRCRCFRRYHRRRRRSIVGALILKTRRVPEQRSSGILYKQTTEKDEKGCRTCTGSELHVQTTDKRF